MIVVKEDRPLAQEAASSWECPRCGGSEWWVCDSRFNGSARRRQRECKGCHSTMNTIELPQKPGFKIAYIPDGKE